MESLEEFLDRLRLIKAAEKLPKSLPTGTFVSKVPDPPLDLFAPLDWWGPTRSFFEGTNYRRKRV